MTKASPSDRLVTFVVDDDQDMRDPDRILEFRGLQVPRLVVISP